MTRARLVMRGRARAMASGEGADRLERGAALLAWLEGEGCAHALRLGETPDAGGVGVFAARDVKRGETLMVMPAACAMRAADTRASPDDDDATADFKAALDRLRGADGAPIDDSARVQLLLLRERAAAWTDGIRSGGRWAHYVRALPGDELTRALPLSWSDENLRRRLAGTAMHADVLADRAALEHLSRALADANARARAPPDGEPTPTPTPTPPTPPFPEDAFGPDRLRWAHAVFWSRAIALPLPSWSRGAGAGAGSDGALTPLLDLCNHAAGSRVSLRARGARVQLVAERDVAEGEEVRIHYGAKGNAELLRRHGFVLPDNPADVCPLTLDELPVETTETGSETRRADGSETFYLFRGMEAFGMLPEGLIRAAVARRRGVRVEDVRDAVEGGGEETAAAARAVARMARAKAARVRVGTAPPIAAAVDPGGFESAPGWRADRAGWEYRRAQRELLEELERAALAAAEAAEGSTQDGNGVR